MVDNSVQLKISDKVYRKVQQIGGESNHSIEAVLQETLDALFADPEPSTDLEKQLAELESYPDVMGGCAAASFRDAIFKTSRIAGQAEQFIR